MAFKLIGGFPATYTFEATVASGVAIATGDMLAISGNVLERATSSSSIHTIVGVAAETISTSATRILVIPVVQGQIWDCEGNAAFASTHLYDSYALTDHDTIANDATDVTGPTGVFLCLGRGSSTTRLIGEFTRLQSTST